MFSLRTNNVDASWWNLNKQEDRAPGNFPRASVCLPEINVAAAYYYIPSVPPHEVAVTQQ